MAVSGSTDSVVGILGVVANVSTARVQKLQLTRDSDDAALWVLDLDLAVLYGEEKS